LARGEAAAAVQQHVATCPSCQEEAEALGRFERGLLVHLLRRSCPTTLTLAEYAAGELAPEARQRTAAHLVECPRCLDESRDAARFLADAGRVEPEAAATGLLPAIGRVLAQPLLARAGLGGLRGEQHNDSVTYAAEDTYVTLAVRRAAPRQEYVITGLWQMLPDDAIGTTVLLRQDDRIIATGAVDDLGSFAFEQVQPGTYSLEIARADGAIIIDSIAAG
jgi:hypothetical protein